MSKKYGQIDLTINEFYSYIGQVIVYNKIITLLQCQMFDVEIKGIEIKTKTGSNTKVVLCSDYIDLMKINHNFNKSTMLVLANYISLYFDSEDTALYFKLKYCSK